MCKSLTPYMLVLGPIVMMAGFVTLPDFEGVVGQEYLDEVKALDFDITFVKMFKGSRISFQKNCLFRNFQQHTQLTDVKSKKG